jgi:bifunctional UDP-N-acetylglucosamine pyrophosphorylase / glucosamine-1-phosphate N-acetyltransferase
VILAAGLGTRMRSRLPKALHKLAGEPMLRHLLRAAEAVFDRIVVVTGPEMQALAAIAAPHEVVVQAERLGTAHAARQAAEKFGEGSVSILYADNPLITPGTLAAFAASEAALSLLATTPPEPGRYGRVVLGAAGPEQGGVERIVEWAEASEAERAIGLCNAGAITARAADLRRWLDLVRADNAKGEYYLTDVVALARAEGAVVAAIEAPFEECRGINSRAELAAAEATLQARLREAAFESGVSFAAPQTVFLAADTVFAPDVEVGPYVVFGPGVQVASGAEIRAFSHLEGCRVGEGAIIGPYARLRPGAEIGAAAHVGNFVEIKAAQLGAGAKANHLAYIGDASVGARTNIGAGTITCNYDGKRKHRTTIGADAFIGSDTALVAPVSVGDGALIGAGSVITEDVPAGSLAIARGRQVIKTRKPTEPK